MQFSGGLSSVRLTVGLDELNGLFQPILFYEHKLSDVCYHLMSRKRRRNTQLQKRLVWKQ